MNVIQEKPGGLAWLQYPLASWRRFLMGGSSTVVLKHSTEYRT